MTIAGDSLPDLVARPPGGARAPLAAAAIAITLHLALALATLAINPARFRAETPIEIDVEEKLPPPEIKPAAPEPPPPPPEPRPHVTPRRVVQEATPTPAPPPPNEEPPKAAASPPVFGVTMSSTVSGGEGIAVPVGNTLMTKPGKIARPGDVSPMSAEGARPFTPVAEMYISKFPEKIYEVNTESIYPADARRMGIEGTVRFRLGIDEKGRVVEVKTIERAGHGFDEAAYKALWQFKFTPAIANDGRPVPVRIEYKYTFSVTQ